MPITEQEYNQGVRRICDSAYEEYAEHGDGEDPDEWFSDWLHQAVDGHQWIIYTAYNTQVLTHTENREAFFDQGLSLVDCDGYTSLMAQLAYCALEQDVRDHIDMDHFGAACDDCGRTPSQNETDENDCTECGDTDD